MVSENARRAGFAALTAALLAAGAAGGFDAQAQTPESAFEDSDVRMLPGDETRARIYTHPELGYSLAVPAGTRMGERGGRRDLFIQSRRGFAVTLQTGPANPARRLNEMAGGLESRYLGEGKVWTRKIAGGGIRAAGLAGYNGLYEGGNTRARAVILRGGVNDFVFLFRAAPDNFLELEREFNWMLENFIPAGADLAAAAKPKPAPEPKPKPEPKPEPKPAPEPEPEPEAAPAPAAEPAPAPATEPEPAMADAGTLFHEPGLGWAIRYPSGWSAFTPSESAAAFSGPPGAETPFLTVSVQNVLAQGAPSPAEAAAAVTRDLRAQFRHEAQNPAFAAAGQYVHDYGGARLQGWQFITAYDRGGRRWRQWTAVMPRSAGNVVHVWSYAAPDESFNEHRPAAEQTLRSWRIGTQMQ